MKDQALPKRSINDNLSWAERLSTAASKEEAAWLVSEVEDWKGIPAQVIAKTISWAVPLPGPFYQIGSTALRAVADEMMRTTKELTKVVLDWAKCADHGTSMLKLQFMFELTASALFTETWENTESCTALYRLYESVGRDYLSRLYNPDLIDNKEDWEALPAFHRFTLYLLRGRSALNQGEGSIFVRCLYDALKTYPTLKTMIEFLLDNTPEPDDSLQFDSLAGQIFALLAAYDPDDPALAELKASPAYQKVACFLESSSPPVYGSLLQ